MYPVHWPPRAGSTGGIDKLGMVPAAVVMFSVDGNVKVVGNWPGISINKYTSMM